MTPDGPLEGADQATAEWLTEALRRSGALPSGRVASVQAGDERTTHTAALVPLAVRYSAEAPPGAPGAFLLKRPRTADGGAGTGGSGMAVNREVEYYLRIAPRVPDLPAPRCFDAALSEDGGRWHLLLEDLSATHEQPPYPVPPSDALCAAAVACLARFHAAWWDDARLGREVGQAPSDGSLRDLCARVERTVTRFMDFLDDRLPPARRGIYERLLAEQLPLRRRQMARPLTLIHGDAHWWNYLYPRAAAGGADGAGARGVDGRVVLIDWQLWSVAPAAGDLAHAIALNWFPERRARLEREVLRRYHDALCAAGVAGYPWDDCWSDYRLLVAKLAFTPAIQWERGIPGPIWWPNLERAMLAFADLDCAELLSG